MYICVFEARPVPYQLCAELEEMARHVRTAATSVGSELPAESLAGQPTAHSRYGRPTEPAISLRALLTPPGFLPALVQSLAEEELQVAPMTTDEALPEHAYYCFEVIHAELKSKRAPPAPFDGNQAL